MKKVIFSIATLILVVTSLNAQKESSYNLKQEGLHVQGVSLIKNGKKVKRKNMADEFVQSDDAMKHYVKHKRRRRASFALLGGTALTLASSFVFPASFLVIGSTYVHASSFMPIFTGLSINSGLQGRKHLAKAAWKKNVEALTAYDN